jgi:hypothetical protein
MAKAYRRTNPVVLNAGMSIGTNAAEFDDEFLFSCFVHYPPVDLCLNVESRGMVVDGRTGSGKTAILRYITSKAEHSVVIDPSEMAMSYVSNSDVLNFLLSAAQGTYEVTGTIIKKAEIEYSRIRREALEQEWQSAFPSIRLLLDHLSKKKKSRLTLEEFCSDSEADDLALAIYSEEKRGFDPLYDIARHHCDDGQRGEIVKSVVGVLYRVGAIGVKLNTAERINYSHFDHPLLPVAQLDKDIVLRIHPMLWGTFHIQ